MFLLYKISVLDDRFLVIYVNKVKKQRKPLLCSQKVTKKQLILTNRKDIEKVYGKYIF